VTTVLQYLVVAAVVALVLFGIALLLFGRGEQLSALPARTSPAVLPEQDISGTDVREVRFALALRGYRMADVDWALERLAEELDRLRSLLAATAATDPSDNDVAQPDTAHRDIQSRDIQGRDIQERDIQDRDIQDRDVQERDIQDLDRQNPVTRDRGSGDPGTSDAGNEQQGAAPSVSVLARPGAVFEDESTPDGPR
jgi:DivIVA domain-containing protein